MRTHIILCHPQPTSLCHALAEQCSSALQAHTHAVTSVNLYDTDFSPILTAEDINRKWPFDTIAQEQIAHVRQSDMIICIHPDWWGAPPAILVGWIQRVWIADVAYRYVGEEYADKHYEALFADKHLAVICATDGSEDSSTVASLHHLWQHIARSAGCRRFMLRIHYDTYRSTLHERHAWINEMGSAVVDFAGR